MTPCTPKHVIRVAGTAVAVAVACLLPACTSGAGATPSDTAMIATADGPMAQQPPDDDLRECLEQNGVPAPPAGSPPGPPPGAGSRPPGPPPAPPGVDQDTWDSAHAACASLAPQPPPR